MGEGREALHWNSANSLSESEDMMTVGKENPESSGNDDRLDRLLKKPQVRLIIGILEVAAVSAALWMLYLTVEERDDRLASRGFRAWGIVLDTTEMALGDKGTNFHKEPAYRNIVGGITAKALEFLDENEESLRGVVLPHTPLIEIELPNAELSYAGFTDSNLSDACFEGATLTGTTFNEAVLEDADFTNADLSSAKLNYADFEGAILTDADLTRASLRCAKNLTQIQLDKACAHPDEPPTFETEKCNEDRDSRVSREPLTWKKKPCPERRKAAE